MWQGRKESRGERATAIRGPIAQGGGLGECFRLDFFGLLPDESSDEGKRGRGHRGEGAYASRAQYLVRFEQRSHQSGGLAGGVAAFVGGLIQGLRSCS